MKNRLLTKIVSCICMLLFKMCQSFYDSLYLALNKTWLRQYSMKELGPVHDCYITKAKEKKEIESLGSGTMKKIVYAKEIKVCSD